MKFFLPHKPDVYLTFRPKAVLGGVSWAEYKSVDSQPQIEANSVFRHIPRISRGNEKPFEILNPAFNRLQLC